MAIDKIAVLLAVIGALNWGGIGLFGFDAVAWLFGGQTAVFSVFLPYFSSYSGHF